MADAWMPAKSLYLNQSGESILAKMIFVNLPVSDLDASVSFYESIGFTESVFTDDTAVCVGSGARQSID